MTDVTIIMTPRERFNVQLQSIDSLIAHTRPPYKLVVVDGDSPSRIRRAMEAGAKAGKFELITRDCFLAPNEARNLALDRVNTEYLVFADNDVLFTDGWLEALLDCARDTGADIIAPLTCIGNPPQTTVHMAGGDLEFITHDDGRREIKSEHRHMNRPLAEARADMKREPCDFAEFHCVFMRTDILKKTGPLDEGLKTTREHVDFCLTARQQGATIWFEPDSVVTYFAPPPLAISDIPFFVHRWNDEWSMDSMRHFMAKWDCWFDVEKRRKLWIETHRSKALEPYRRKLEPVLGWERSMKLRNWVENRLIARARARRAAALGRSPAPAATFREAPAPAE